MNLKELESNLIEIIKEGINDLDSINIKSDNSIVTNCDIHIEKNLIIYLKKKFPKIDIISEEHEKSHKKTYKLKNRFAIIDPIDGTENFYFFQNIYGCAISIVYDEIDYHLIYLPYENKKISTISNPIKTIKQSNIELYSTSCLGLINVKEDRQSKRVLGSSSFMFYIILSSAAKSYKYCGKAKIWDYYTGISLVLKSNLNLKVTFGKTTIKDLPISIPHKCNFLIETDE
tara:strand:+ start:459 stop:1148 length:690 start_codon:yes stop_codon:yes gene_type:complete